MACAILLRVRQGVGRPLPPLWHGKAGGVMKEPRWNPFVALGKLLFALVLIGVVLAMGTLASQKSLYRDTVMGNYGMAAVLVIVGSVLVGSVAE